MPGKSNTAERKCICGICPAGCWVVVTFDSDGKIDKVRADESSDLGMICKLGEHSREIVYSKDRIRYPMKRVGPKGTFEFERITWDQAYESIAEKFNRIKADQGPEATAIYTGRGSFELSLCDIFQPEGVAVSSASSVLFPFGSPNTLGVGALCYVSFAMIAPHVTCGGMLINMYSDIENAELVVVWGANPATDCPPLDFNRIIKARERGAEVVVIDPRRTSTAKATGAQWIPIRSGTDGSLALGMINVLIEEELYDEKFVDNWTLGFDDLKRYVQHFRPETVESVTGVPSETVRSLARRIAEARGASPVMYSGLEYSDSGVQAIRATQVLWALAGQLDTPGGRCFSMRDNHFPINRSGHIPNPDMKKALGRDRFPVYSQYRGESHAISLPDSVLRGKPYKISALITLGGSIITAWPESGVWKETLNALDFLVCVDRQLTADSAYADIVLPATTYYEIDSYMTYGPIFRLREKVIEPIGEARNDYTILTGLAECLGYAGAYPKDERAMLRHALEGSGYSLEDAKEAGGIIRKPTAMSQYKKWEKGTLRPDGAPGFDTPSGKFEIHSTILEEHGYDPLPVYTEPVEGPLSRPDLADRFPLVFNSGSRVTTDFRSQFHSIPSLVKERPEPTVTINTQDAESRGIKNGDMVHVTTARGKVKFRAMVTDDIVKGSVDANMGGGGPVGPEAWRRCNVNELTDISRYDPISGFPIYKTLLCQVSAVESETSCVVIGSGEIAEVCESSGSFQEGVTAERQVYMDNNATTRMDPEVASAMEPFLTEHYANPSSVHTKGAQIRFSVGAARRKLAVALNCAARRIVFTGGGSEANNLAIKGAAFAHRNKGRHIITSAIEHPAVGSTCRWLEKFGFEITRLAPDTRGLLDPGDLEDYIRPDTILVSVMMANNETGAIQPIAEMAKIAKTRGMIFHTDAVQGLGKIHVDVKELGVDMLSLSGHKFNGPKGVGALYIRQGVRVEPLVHGGSQEGGLRAGTENVASIAGLGKAAELIPSRLSMMGKLAAMRDRLRGEIMKITPEAFVNGPEHGPSLPNTLNMTLPGYRGESVVLAMDRKGVYLSSGSACRSGSPDPSHALLAMGLSEEEAHCSVRFSLGHDCVDDDIDHAARSLREVVEESSSVVRFAPCR